LKEYHRRFKDREEDYNKMPREKEIIKRIIRTIPMPPNWNEIS
jgi:hypothetical protein